ncbi:MAG: RluA family pseudouridine synthase [Holophagales bacterium]|jgi:23S rRNA pseudouridine1911/1915/1917 synthase|nr:RluA family pseudouridine synthase [Holophagales bacterium]
MTQLPPKRQSWRFIVEPDEAAQRLDQIVSARTGLSRRKAREILKFGGVQVNCRRVRVAGRTLALGAEIRVTLDSSLGAEPNIKPEVLFEDDWILALNKPSGISTQGTQASDRHDFLALARRCYIGQDLHLVHRLDTGTSGILLLAKGAGPASEIGRLFREHDVRKTYLAAIPDHLEPCVLEMPIGRVSNTQPVRYGCAGTLIDAKPATTDFYPADTPVASAGIKLPDANWVAAKPLTGRTHQIRVHLAYLGNPIIGDVFYGGLPSNRLWLHAWKLEMVHPIIGEPIRIEAIIDHNGGIS